MEITERMFREAVAVPMQAGTDIFDAVTPEIDNTEQILYQTVMGDAGRALLDNEESTTLRRVYSRAVCVMAFLTVLRQLDLVLTPTGFGVVSSEQYAPASKMRVDALEGQLKNQRARALAHLVETLRSPEWGVSPQAAYCIPTVYDAFFYFYNSPNTAASEQMWLERRKMVEEADDALRQRMGNAQMDAIVQRYRCRQDDCDILVNRNIRRFMDQYANDGAAHAIAYMWHNIVKVLSEKTELYHEWAESPEYKAFTHERYKNTKSSPAYFFGG